MTDYMMRLSEVTIKTGLSRSTIDRMEADGKFPKRRKLSERAIGWRSSDVEKWIKGRELA